MKDKFKLLGRRIYLNLPPQKESKLEVDHNTKEALQKEMLKKLSRLVVYAVGTEVTTIEQGDVVLVDPEAVSKAVIIPDVNGEPRLLVSVFDVIHIWE
jgi:adenine-specific DNA methylase